MTQPYLLCLAPMAGVTGWPMRVLCYRMGADTACTEMVSAMGLMCAKPGNEAYRQLLETDPEERSTACQLFGKDAAVMGEAAERVTSLGRFAALDINMGCPARKIVSGGEGSALTLNPELAYRVMEAVKKHTTLPVTLKLRLGYDAEHMNALEMGLAAQSLGFRQVVIHGRTRMQQYAGKADYAAIARVKERLTIPVIANGDVFSPEDAARALQETGCDGLMIGRGAIGNPWLFRSVRQALAGKPVQRETPRERIQTAILHAEWMVAFKGEKQGVLEMRAHIGRYIGGMRGATALRRELNSAKTLAEIRVLLTNLLEAEEGMPT